MVFISLALIKRIFLVRFQFYLKNGTVPLQTMPLEQGTQYTIQSTSMFFLYNERQINHKHLAFPN